MKRWIVLAALLAPVSAFGAEAKSPKPSPVAVMPFKNLNADSQIDWLKQGIAETMISDLKKEKLTVVERDQLDKAMAELALQGNNGTEESTASKVGKMVGAKTVVLGGFQKAGKDMRITARFVSVETGEVLDTAKATGTLQNIFSLQDEITARLLGKQVAAAKPKTPKSTGVQPADSLAFMAPRKPGTDKTVEAYKLYAMSLSSSSEADRITYLKKSLEIDPDFTYSTEALDALQKRMASYSQGNQIKSQQISGDLRAQLAAAATPEDKAKIAMNLMTQDTMGFRYHALLADATLVYGMPDVQMYYTTNLHEMAAYYVFLAHMQLKHPDQALQAGEAYMKEFQGGMYFNAVQMQMDQMVSAKRGLQDKKAEADKYIGEVEKDRAEANANTRQDAAWHEMMNRNYDFRRCSTFQSYAQWDDVFKECTAFANKWADSTDDQVKQFVFIARYAVVQGYADRGDFEKARKLADQLVSFDPKRADQFAVRTVASTWPRD